MGKRSGFERIPNDAYTTPLAAVVPLVPHLRGIRTFCEPCAGDGALVRHLEAHGLRCVYAGDIADGGDALAVERYPAPVITNPPWSRPLLHLLIEHFVQTAPCAWLLFDADWAHTRQSVPFLPRCSHILPIGRVKWIPNTRDTGKDNAAWYRFDARHDVGPLFLPYRGDRAFSSARTCQQCGGIHRGDRSDAKFCSNACRQRAYRQRLSVTMCNGTNPRRTVYV
jgi:hypothetical protein